MTGMNMNVGGHGSGDAEVVYTQTELCDFFDIAPLFCVVLHTVKHQILSKSSKIVKFLQSGLVVFRKGSLTHGSGHLTYSTFWSCSERCSQFSP